MSQSDLTKQAIANAMKELMRYTSIEKITTDKIIEKAAVSRRSFYRYFADKYELLGWIYDHDFCRFVEVTAEKSIWDYYPDICRSLYADKNFYCSAFSYEGQNSFRAFCFEKLFPLIMNDFGDIFPNEKIARFVVRSYVYSTFDGFVWWLGQEPCMPWEDYVALSEGIIRATADGITRSFERALKNQPAAQSEPK